LVAKTNRYAPILAFRTGIYRFTVSSLMRLHNLKTVADAYAQFVDGAIKPATFRTWIGHGTKFATIAGAGECQWLFNRDI